MDPSGCLPEPAVLEALLASAGVITAAWPATASALDVVRFPPPRDPRDDVAAIDESAIDLHEDTVAWEPADADASGRRRPLTLPPLEHAGTARPGSFAELRSIEERLAVLVDWLTGTTAAYSAFVADGDGLALANRNTPDNYVAATAMIGRAQQLVDAYVPAPVDGATSMELDDGNTLQIVWVSTDAGRLAAGIVLPQPLPRPFCATVREMVRTAVANEETR